MVRNLLLIRHAEAEFPSERKRDFDRNLTTNGQNQGIILASYLKELPFELDAIYHSPSKRTLQTSQFILDTLNKVPRMMDAEELYEATGNLMRAFVNRMDDNFKNVAIVAHNPGIAELHNYLTRKFESYSPSTCSWLEGEFESWSHITENSFTERDFYYPGQIG
ncbi:MAG: histidine phosphatase family protein [Roseivirga sp.]|uniref:SixA phosphatase family protein n=1 Tax=Roseivirga sp. TaxID=1964215 RepID=UPI001B228AA6|nr:histidine phosphatase family protein [Roseivirga sp.]MBO6659868.1 histidine phosphatase family protein [Roseivirga sp.]MBO6907395.1 histidine phosphatase family protein [Roseivirga sp.]